MKILLENYLIAKANFFLNLAHNLQKQGHEVYFLTEIEGPFYRACRKHGFNVLRPKYKNKKTRAKDPKFKDVVLIHTTRRRRTLKQVDDEVITYYESYKEEIEDLGIDRMVVFNGMAWFGVIIAKELGIKCYYMENGYFPRTIQIDTQGVNKFASFNRPYKEFMKLKPPKVKDYKTDVLPLRTRTLWDRVTEGYYQVVSGDWFPLHKYIWTKKKNIMMFFTPKKKTPTERFIFIPFQVHDDTQLLANSPYLNSMNEMLDTVVPAIKEVYPDHLIVVKEHPEDVLRISYKDLKEKYPEICWIRKGDVGELIKKADAVINVNSSVGFQALQEGKRVLTLGEAFYNNNPFIENAKSKADVLPKLRKLKNKDIPRAEVNRYLDIFRKLFIRGTPADFSRRTMRDLVSYILR